MGWLIDLLFGHRDGPAERLVRRDALWPEVRVDRSQDPEVVRRNQYQMVDAGSPEQEPSVGEEALASVGVEIKLGVQEFEEAERKRREAESNARYSVTSGGRFSLATPDELELIRMRVDRGRAFGRKLVGLVSTKCDGHASWCYQRAGVSRQVYSQIISNPDRQPSMRTVMQLAIGLRLNRPEADQFLAAAGYAFRPNDFEEQVFAHCLERGIYSMFDVNELLVACNCQPIALN